MQNERLQYLVEQYKLAKKRLGELVTAHRRIEVAFNIFNDLEKELKKEIKGAEESKNSSSAQYWQDILKSCLPNDKDRPKEEEIKSAKEKISGENEKLIAYYQKKIKIIEQLMGSREAELMESYEHKNILMGSEHSSRRLFQEIEKDEELKAEEDKKNKGFTFDKM
jgi:hypothetical protein